MDTFLNILEFLSGVIHAIPIYIFIIGGYVLFVDYSLRQMPRFSDFLDKYKKNYHSVIIINVMAWAGVIGVYYDSDTMALGWQIFCYCFLALIMFLGWARVYLIHKRIERIDEMYNHTSSNKK